MEPKLTTIQKIDKVANKYNQTKDQKYKDQWYKLIKEFADGSYNFKRRSVSIDSSHKTDDGWNSVDKRR